MKQINFYGMSLLKNVPTVDKQQMIKVCSSHSIIVIVQLILIKFSQLCERIGEPQPHAYKRVSYNIYYLMICRHERLETKENCKSKESD